MVKNDKTQTKVSFMATIVGIKKPSRNGDIPSMRVWRVCGTAGTRAIWSADDTLGGLECASIGTEDMLVEVTLSKEEKEILFGGKDLID